ncbi:uncharacterized protein BP5553_05834 [Venustampulla echinocandica]|uniref:Uncharacterized protein n=1 Tax=Venustampulla echinocandica TaxID=2656787 RepID=A0A370TLS5_9HELO|nr:uncharacterized protein BP5553_05834 [Venustampulla echinocandica]RDL36482.1 hypothetical protein BP5553_05834 [Venustampulla echinocandica]
MQTPLPSFTDPTHFPTFKTIPQTSTSSVLTPSDQEYFLLGTIQENMTLTPLTPTFICRDRSGASFALTIKLRPGQDSDDDDRSFYKSKEGKSRFKKGACVVAKGARRKGFKEDDGTGKGGKQGFVES